MVIRGLLFQSSAASDFYRLGKVRLCEEQELCMGKISSQYRTVPITDIYAV